jgi:hypothetical protein
VIILLAAEMKSFVPSALLYWHLLLGIIVLPASLLYCVTVHHLERKFRSIVLILLSLLITLTPQTLATAIYLKQFFYRHFLQTPETDFLTSEHLSFISICSVALSFVFIAVDRLIRWRWETKKSS